MNVSIAQPAELGSTELEAWHVMQRSDIELDNAFLSPEFAVAVGRARPETRVAVIEDGGLAAFFAFETTGPRRADAICARLSDLQAVVQRTGFEWDAHDLLKRCGLDSWQFRRLVGAQARGAGRRIDRLRAAPLVELASGFDDYAARHRSTVKSIRAQRRRLEREVGALHFEARSSDRASLDTLRAWKSAQYRSGGRWDRLAEPWVVRLFDELIAARDLATLDVLWANDRVAAAHFGLRTGSTLSYWFPAYDPALSRYSPGLILALELIEDAAASGLTRVDLGVGDEAYKQRLMTGELRLAEGAFERASFLRRARAALHRRTMSA